MGICVQMCRESAVSGSFADAVYCGVAGVLLCTGRLLAICPVRVCLCYRGYYVGVADKL